MLAADRVRADAFNLGADSEGGAVAHGMQFTFAT
jgi:hypothetical protein